MPPSSAPTATIGYVVTTWPRLSQTFILNEILALERRGQAVRIFSTKLPDGEPTHAKVTAVRAQVAYLAFRRCAPSLVLANLRVAQRRPGSYARTFLKALRCARPGVLWRFLQAGYLADLVGRHAVAHLHAHFATGPALVAMLAHDLVGIPYSFTAHARDIYVDTPPELLRAEMESARTVVTVSEYNRQYLVSRSPHLNGKVRRIECGLDLDEFRCRWPRAADPGPPVILTVARLVEKKGLVDLILAADLLRRQGHSFRVQIIGDGPLRSTLVARVAERGLEDWITLLGAQPQEVVRAAYERAAIFVLPCVMARDGDRDGLPVALLEAMASGVPVVSTSVVGIPELIDAERDGLIVPPNDAHALAHTLARLLVDPKLRDRLAEAARGKIEERFSIDGSVDRLLTVFAPAEGGDVHWNRC